MKTVLIAIMTSILTAGLTTLILQHQSPPRPSLIPQVLTVHELRVVDSAGVVRARLSVEGSGRGAQIPALELLPAGNRGGVLLALNNDDLGTLYFSSPSTEAKVLVGHYWGCDSEPDTEDHCGAWGMNILNPEEKDGSPGDVGLLLGSNGKVYLPSAKR